MTRADRDVTVAPYQLTNTFRGAERSSGQGEYARQCEQL